LQRAGRELLHCETKTEALDDELPLPALCLAALKIRRDQQRKARTDAGELWQDRAGLVFTTRYRTPIEPGTCRACFRPGPVVLASG
jgi:hypothetical protein